MIDLGIREIWDEDTIIFLCGCHKLRWPWKALKRAVRLDCCGKHDHFDTLLPLINPQEFRWADQELQMICYDERSGFLVWELPENLADLQEKE